MKQVETMLQEIKWDDKGLVPAIVQDASSKAVLMLAYVNEEALKRSVATQEAWFWSRSREELWHKGATSGHTQKIRDIYYDCDADTLLMLVDPQGPACHTGQYSCFYRSLDLPENETGEGATSVPKQDRFAMLSKLEQVIAQREAEMPEGAYTTYLFDKGVDKILKKVGEESAEVIIAAKNKDNDELRMETSDLLFHLLVLLRERKLSLDEVMEELRGRHAD